MKVGLTQMDIVFEDKKKNMEQATRIMEQAAKEHVDILVFPEMTLTGFTMNTKLAGEEMLLSPTLQFFKEASVMYNMAIVFGYVEDFGEEYYNKLMIVADGKVLLDYDKIHPFTYGEEGRHYVGGHEVKRVEYQNTVLSGFVCYDLRFPEIFQAVSDEAEIIFVIANWPQERVLHWKTLLQARAIENQCFIVGVNRVGAGNGLTYTASSMAFDALGNLITERDCEAELMVVELPTEHVKAVRQQFPFKQDRKNVLYKKLMV